MNSIGKNKLMKLPRFEIPPEEDDPDLWSDFNPSDWNGKLLKTKKTPIFGSKNFGEGTHGIWGIRYHNQQFGVKDKLTKSPKTVMLGIDFEELGNFKDAHEEELNSKGIDVSNFGIGLAGVFAANNLLVGNENVTLDIDYYINSINPPHTPSLFEVPNRFPKCKPDRYLGGQYLLIFTLDIVDMFVGQFGLVTGAVDDTDNVFSKVRDNLISFYVTNWNLGIKQFEKVKAVYTSYQDPNNDAYIDATAGEKSIFGLETTTWGSVTGELDEVTYSDKGVIPIASVFTANDVWEIVKEFYGISG